MAEYMQKHKETNVSSGSQTITINLSKGTYQAVKEVIVSVGDTGDEWGPDGYFEVHRTDGTPSANTKLGETYLNSSNMILFEEGEIEWSRSALKIVIDHNAGTTKNVLITVRYAYQ